MVETQTIKLILIVVGVLLVIGNVYGLYQVGWMLGAYGITAAIQVCVGIVLILVAIFLGGFQWVGHWQRFAKLVRF